MMPVQEFLAEACSRVSGQCLFRSCWPMPVQELLADACSRISGRGLFKSF
jgi:hypothetical protein